MTDFATLDRLAGARTIADIACPECGPGRSTPASRNARKLRLWRLSERAISFHCVRCGIDGTATRESATPLSEAERRAMEQRFAEARQRDDEERQRKTALARRLWSESVDSKGTWADEYLAGRGIQLPANDYVRKLTLRFHPECPFPGSKPRPALLAAFTSIMRNPALDVFEDDEVIAVHRITGRGHDNKAMLGAVGGAAVMISPREQVGGVLHIAEGIETALKLYQRGQRPIWALGSAGAVEAFPVIPRVRKLVIWADNDPSGRGIEAAETCATRWSGAGRHANIWMQDEEGADYGEA